MQEDLYFPELKKNNKKQKFCIYSVDLINKLIK